MSTIQNSNAARRVPQRRAQRQGHPLLIERKLRWDRGSAYFGFDDHGGWEHERVARQIIEAALALDGEEIFFAIEHIGPANEVPIGRHLQGHLYGCSFARDEEASRRLWQESAGEHGWVNEGPAMSFISTVHGNGYHVLIGSPQHGFKRPQLTVPTFDPRDGEDFSLEWRTIKFSKWRDDDFGPPLFKRAELTIWPQTKRHYLFNGYAIEKTACVSGVTGEPFPILDSSWRPGTKGRDEHGAAVQFMWRLLPPQPQRERLKETRPLIVQVAEKLWARQ
jgi:hypothetical protein